MRTSEQIYHRVRWDPQFDPARFVLGVSRRQAEPKRIPLPAFVPGGEVPWHRVLFIEADGEPVWDRSTGLDVLDRVTVGRIRAPRRLHPPFFTPGTPHRFEPGAGWRPGTRAAEPGGTTVRVLTWNTLWDRYDGDRIDTARRRPLLLAALRAADADVVALQEVEAGLLALLLADPWVRASYTVDVDPAGREVEQSGLLLLSRLPVTEAARHRLGPHKALAAVTVSTPVGPVVVATTHLSSDHSERGADRRQAELDRLAEGFAGLGGELVLVGDFNEDGDRPTAALGLRDAWTVVHGPGDRTPTFDPAANPLAAVGSLSGRAARLDRVLLRPGTLGVTGAALLGTAPAAPDGLFVSDHYGVVAELSLTGAEPHEVLDLAPTARTALAWLPPEEVRTPVQRLRHRFDGQVWRWPPHVNLLFGFVPESAFERAAPLLGAAAAEVAPFTAQLAGVHTFGHREDATVWLDPAAGGEAPWAELHRALSARFPRCHGRAEGFTPHLTLGRSADPQSVAAACTTALEPATARVGELVLLSRRGEGPMEVRARVELGTGRVHWTERPLGRPDQDRLDFGAPLDGDPEAGGLTEGGPAADDPARRGPAEAGLDGPDQADPLLADAARPVLGAASVAARIAAALPEAAVYAVGSRRIGGALPGADLDLVAALPGAAVDPAAVRERLTAALPAGTEVRPVVGARVPGLRLRVAGPPHPAVRCAPTPPGWLTVDLVLVAAGPTAPGEAVARRAELAEPAAVALSAVSDAAAIRAAVGERWADFAGLLGWVKAWARARGLDTAPFGGLPGLAWSVLAARTVQQAGDLPAAELLERFFADWAAWDWQQPIALLPDGPTGPATPAPVVTVLTPTHPVRSCTEQVGAGFQELLAEELYRGWELLAAGSAAELCAAPPMHRRHAAWAVLTIGQQSEDFAETLGRVRGRLRALLGVLAEEVPQVHAWPHPFESGPPRTRYAIGLGPTPPDRTRLAELADRWTRGLPGVAVEWAEGGAVPTLA
ncbi:poly(A) polymerase [Kitasatospora sp. LaBMicrA B282]|uniref:poly(A) polymerase n=1 Tax=Kitasatospora sp. LaBMicrA B282 TaxID=3420949 RepID=UPI003D120654